MEKYGYTRFGRVEFSLTYEIMKPVYWIVLLFLVSCGTQTKKDEINFWEASKAETEKKWEEEIQKWIETRKWIDDSRRLEAVSSEILLGAAAYCEKLKHLRPYIGARGWSRHMFEDKWQQVATSRFGLGDEVELHLVNPGSPADKAGIKVRDVVLAINGRPIQKGAKAVKQFEETIKEAPAGKPLSFTLRRDGEHHEVFITPSVACKGEVILTDDSSLNSNADDEKIKISKGLMGFFEHNEEIAVVVSHELAHNLGKHHTQTKLYSFLFGTLGAGVGFGLDVATFVLTGSASTAFGEAFMEAGVETGQTIGRIKSEQQADYIGLHLMALAGYEIERASIFWRRVATIEPEARNMVTQHPISDRRISEMDATIKGIKDKIRENSLVIPD